jgi:hypothetical protein
MPSWYDQLMSAFTLDNTQLLVVAAITFLIGYLEYMYSFALMRREKRAPYPIWMHTFYLAHDSSWAVIMFVAAAHNHGYWFFVATGIALLIWNFFEIFNIWKAVTVERQEIWGDYYQGEVTVRQALGNVAIQVAAMYTLVNILISFMGPGSIMQWFLFTNMLIGSAPGVLWMKRGAKENTRRGASMGLAIVILVGTINSFLPTSMWVLAMPEVFDTPIYYLTGAVFTFISAFNLYQLSKLPPKTATPAPIGARADEARPASGVSPEPALAGGRPIW